MFISEIYSDNFDLSILFNLEKKEIPILLSTARLEATKIAYNHRLLNNIEMILLKTYGDDFKQKANMTPNLSEIMSSILSQNSSILFNKSLKNYTDGLASLNDSIFLKGMKNIVTDYYELKVLGEGSFGIVYLAIDSKTGNKVVVKKAKKVIGNEIEEYKALIDLKSECSNYYTCVIDAFATNNSFYLIMEYNEGYITLGDCVDVFVDIFKNNSVSGLKNISNIFSNLVKGLSYMHKKQIAHNDIKPDNIMVNLDTGGIKYIDFGISCHGKECRVDRDEGFGFTYWFLDPYIYNKHGIKELTEEDRNNADIWAIGITMYQLIMGFVPMSKLYNDKLSYFKNYDFKNDPYRNEILNNLNKLDYNIDIDFILRKK